MRLKSNKTDILFHMMMLVAVLAVSTTPSLVLAQGRTEIIVQNFDLVPGGSEFFIDVDFSPVLNNNRQIVFKARISDPQLGTRLAIFLFDGSSILEIVRTGQLAPDGNGFFISFDDQIKLDDAGNVAFAAGFSSTAGGSNDDTGLCFGDENQLFQVVREGQSDPDGNGTLPQFPTSQYSHFVLSNQADVIFHANLNGSPIGGVFRGAGFGLPLTVVALRADPAPGGGVFGSPFSHSCNQSGGVSFRSAVTGGSTGIFFKQGTSITAIAQEGQTAPDGLGVYTNLLQTGSIFGISAPNETGKIAFLAETDLSPDGVFLSDGTQMENLAFVNEQAPGGGSFTQFYTPYLNDSDQVAFKAQVTSPFGSGLFIRKAGTIHAVAREGDSVPDSTSEFLNFDTVSRQPAINGAGVVLFESLLSSASGIFLGSEAEQIQIARVFQDFDGNTIQSIDIRTGRGGLNGTGLNDFSQVAFSLDLAADRTAIGLFTPDLNWKPTTSGNWDDAENWTLGLSPGQPHDVFINPDTSLTVNGSTDIEGALIRNLTIGDVPVQGGVELNWEQGFVLHASQQITIREFGRLTGGGLIEAAEIEISDGQLISSNMVITTGHLCNEGTLRCIGSLEISGELENNRDVIVDGNGSNGLVVNGDFRNDGDLILNPGTLTRVSGEYSGGGDATGTGQIIIEGMLSPRGNGTGQIQFTQSTVTLGTNTIFNVQIAGTTSTQFDSINSIGTLNLDGQLNVALVNGFQLQSGQQFDIGVVFDALNGQFNGLGEGDLVGTFGDVDLFITYTAGDGNDVALYTDGATTLLGDVNLDGVVNLLDVQPFVSVLTGAGFQAEADCNQDGVVNLLDVQPFVNILTGQ